MHLPASCTRLLRQRGLARFALVEVTLWVLAYPIYMASRELAISGPATAQRHARDLLELEGDLGLRFEHAVQSAVTSLPLAQPLADGYYELAFYPLVTAVLVSLALWQRETYREARRAMFIAMGLALVLFVLDPTAPPRLVHGLGIQDTVGMTGHDVGSFHGIDYNPYAAMPSLHVGWSLIVAHAVYRAVRVTAVRVLAVLHPILMTIATIATGNHYVLDCLVGAGVALLALRLASAWRERARGRAGVPVGATPGGSAPARV
jgi:hypothetical protein